MTLTAALISLLILTTFISSTHSASCCLMYVKRPLPCKALRDYAIQSINTSCDINAVIFHLPGRFVCADPSASWTRRGIKCLHDRKRRSSRIIKQEAEENNNS